MVRHNNMIPHAHFHKKWKTRVKMWFDQPMKKKQRAVKRKIKIKANAPRPAKSLRPLVHCPTSRYNFRLRLGRGFSIQELKLARLNKKYAQSIGIAVDVRKYSKSIDSVMLNAQRLKEYHHKLIVFPINKKKQKEELTKPFVTIIHGINKPAKMKVKIKARVPSEEEKAFCAYKYVQKARFEIKRASAQQRKKKLKTEGLEMSFKKNRYQQDQD